MFRGIIFDIGGVIVDVKIKSFLRQFVKESGLTKEQLYSMIVLGNEWERFEKGLITEDRLKEMIEKGHGIKPDLMDRMASDWRASIRPIPETLEIIRNLRGKYKLFALSNVDENTTKECFDRFDFYKLFDGVVLSWKVRMRKPEPGIYEYTLKKMGLSPRETVFIDNYPPNLPAAEEMGIKTILFKSPAQLKRDLRKMGIEA